MTGFPIGHSSLLEMATSLLVIACVCMLVVQLCDCTIAPSTKGRQELKGKKSAVAVQSVWDRNLLEEAVTSKSILANHDVHGKNDAKNFAGETLAYLTPWNSRGFEIATKFASKFTYISPVWLQLKPAKDKTVSIGGEQDVKAKWIKQVRASSTTTRIVPRYIIEGFNGQQLNTLFQSSSLSGKAADTIIKSIKKHGFDGMVLEVVSQLGGQLHDGLKKFVDILSKKLHENKFTLIVVLPPNGDTALFNALSPSVDRLMTYDYSSGRSSGPNAPLPWMQQVVMALTGSSAEKRSKLLLGLNFYGMDFVGGHGSPIVGGQFVDVLRAHHPTLLWEDDAQEHVAMYGDAKGQHQVYYPTLQSISKRVELASQLNTGISIWEIGQGLDYFYDLL